MRTFHHPAAEELDLATVLYALSDPVRLGIAARLALVGESACGRIVLRMPRSSLSHHLRVLRESGVTRTRVDGKRLMISLRRGDLDARFPGLLDAVLRAAPVPAEVGRPFAAPVSRRAGAESGRRAPGLPADPPERQEGSAPAAAGAR